MLEGKPSISLSTSGLKVELHLSALNKKIKISENKKLNYILGRYTYKENRHNKFIPYLKNEIIIDD